MKCYNKRATHTRWRIHRTLPYSPHHVPGATADLMLHLPFFFLFFLGGRKASTQKETTEKLQNYETVAMQNFRQRDHWSSVSLSKLNTRLCEML